MHYCSKPVAYHTPFFDITTRRRIFQQGGGKHNPSIHSEVLYVRGEGPCNHGFAKGSARQARQRTSQLFQEACFKKLGTASWFQQNGPVFDSKPAKIQHYAHGQVLQDCGTKLIK